MGVITVTGRAQEDGVRRSLRQSLKPCKKWAGGGGGGASQECDQSHVFGGCVWWSPWTWYLPGSPRPFPRPPPYIRHPRTRSLPPPPKKGETSCRGAVGSRGCASFWSANTRRFWGLRPLVTIASPAAGHRKAKPGKFEANDCGLPWVCLLWRVITLFLVDDSRKTPHNRT